MIYSLKEQENDRGRQLKLKNSMPILRVFYIEKVTNKIDG